MVVVEGTTSFLVLKLVSAYGHFDEKHFYDIWTPYVTYGPPYVVFIMWKNSLQASFRAWHTSLEGLTRITMLKTE